MIRKIIHIILIATLVILTSGVSITRHFCGDNLIAVGIMTIPPFCCDMEGCCHNETETLFLEDDYTITSVSLLPQQSESNLHVALVESSLPVEEIVEVFAKAQFKSYLRPPPPGDAEKQASLQVFIL